MKEENKVMMNLKREESRLERECVNGEHPMTKVIGSQVICDLYLVTGNKCEYKGKTDLTDLYVCNNPLYNNVLWKSYNGI